MWDLPGPGLEPVSPELAGRFLTTAPPGKSLLDNSETPSVEFEATEIIFKSLIKKKKSLMVRSQFGIKNNPSP